ncbi:MAG: universal stress protein [Chitinophagales bacterium]|nr:universal stress protein [Chitinophagales bacterium]
MYKILFLTDFSEHSNHAKAFTQKLAVSSQSDVIIFHALFPVTGSITQMGATVELTSVLYNSATESLQRLEKEFNEVNINTQSIILTGDIIHQVENVVKENKVDLIIMGTHGMNNIIDRITGSVAAYVLTRLDIPTIVIPFQYHQREIKKIVFAHQLSAPRVNHLEAAFEFAKFLNILHIDVVHIYSDELDVYQPNREIINELKEKFRQESIGFHFIKNESVVNGIYQYMQDNQTDFLITSSNKKTFWKRLMSGNISATLATEFDTPILVLKG